MPEIPQPNVPPEGEYNDIEQLFIAEQPKKLWPVNQNSNFGTLRKVLTTPIQQAADQVTQLFLDMFFSTATTALSRHEAEYDIPDGTGELTDAERRAIISGRVKRGLFTRARRQAIVEEFIQATYGQPALLYPEGIPLTPAGIPLFSGLNPVETLYLITEDISGFEYDITLDVSVTVDEDSLIRELRAITPAGINFTIGAGEIIIQPPPPTGLEPLYPNNTNLYPNNTNMYPRSTGSGGSTSTRQLVVTWAEMETP